MSKLIDDVGHIVWGAGILLAFMFLHPVVAVVLAVLPREVEQAVHALLRRGEGFTLPAIRKHISWSWFWRKSRDLLGFVVGACIVLALI